MNYIKSVILKIKIFIAVFRILLVSRLLERRYNKRLITETAERKYWKCKRCGYALSEIQYLSVVCDVGCPRCNASLSTFYSVTADENDRNL